MNELEFVLNSSLKAATLSLYSLSSKFFDSSLMTSVMIYKTDKIIRRSTESAKLTVSLCVAELAAMLFLKQKKVKFEVKFSVYKNCEFEGNFENLLYFYIQKFYKS